MRGPPGPDLGGPLFLQGGAAVQPEQVRQRDVRPDLDRLPGPLRHQVRGDQAAHALIVKMHRDFHHISAASNYRPLSTLIADGLSDNTSPSTVVRLELRP